MEQFSLEKYLENPSRKVVTRQGNPVRIICTDRKHTQSWPIVALESYDSGEFVLYTDDKGRTDLTNENIHDLFFSDEEEELTEFERELEMMMVSFSNGNLGSDVIKEMPKQKLHNYANRLLDLAKNEILKDLSEWKKVDSNPPKVQYNLQGKRLYKNGEYYIELSDLEALSKEE